MEIYNSEKEGGQRDTKTQREGKKQIQKNRGVYMEMCSLNISNDLFKITRLTASPVEILFIDLDFIKTLAVF